jgi:hypothetical protein
MLVLIMLLVITMPGCACARIAAEYEITNIPHAIDIYSGPTGYVNGQAYLCVEISIQKKSTETGIIIFNLQDPDKPKQIAYLESPDGGSISGLCSKDNIFYVAYSNYLSLLDVSNPSTPREIGRISAIDAQSMTISGEYAYICDDEGNILVAEISTPASPVIVTTWEASDFPYKMITDSTNLILFTNKGVHIVDISTPTSLKEVGYVSNPGYSPRVYVHGGFKDIAVFGKYLFIAADTHGMQVFDITDPVTSLKIAEIIGPEDYSSSILVKGNLAYLMGDKSVFIIDVSNPVKPEKIGSIDLPHNTSYPNYLYKQFVEANNYLYIPTRISVKEGLVKLVIEILDVTTFRDKK